jgi:hypothetical protein
MVLVTDCLNANKPATPESERGKLTTAQLNNNKDLEVDLKKEEPSFFDSFFSSAKSQQQKDPQAIEEARPFLLKSCCHVFIFQAQPPEVIRTIVKRSKRRSSVRPTSPRVTAVLITLCRVAHTLIFHYREARDDRHGAQSHLIHACQSLEGEPAARAAAGTL